MRFQCIPAPPGETPYSDTDPLMQRKHSNHQKGFAIILFLSWLPIFLTLGMLSNNSIRYIQQRAQLRYLCLQQSLKIQKELFSIRHDPVAFRKRSRELASELENRLRRIHPDIKMSALPIFNTQKSKKHTYKLAYKLQSSLSTGLQCGVLSAEGPLWDFKIIYQTARAKF